jgi:hypothetical protein
MDVVTKTGDLRLFAWLLSGPRWRGELVGVFILLVGLFAVALFIEGRRLILAKQYKGMFPGYLFLGGAYALAYAQVSRYLPAQTGRWYQSAYAQMAYAAVGVLFFLALTVPETIACLKYYDAPPSVRPKGVLTLRELLSPAKIYQNVVNNGLLPYLLASLLAPALFAVPGQVVAKVLIGVMLAVWGYLALWYDNRRPRPDMIYIHVDDGWPIFQRPLRRWFRGWWWPGRLGR